MTTHEPTVYDDGPTATPRYRTDWHGTTPEPADLILMSVELFERCIHILNNECANGEPIAYIYKAGTPDERVINPTDVTIAFKR